MRLSDSIEAFIKSFLQDEQHEVELKRNELAQYFGCAPSQINYVLSTRFTPDDGYTVESRRGGGGYIRVVRVICDEALPLPVAAAKELGNAVTQPEAIRLLTQLLNRNAISVREAEMIQAGISRQALAVPIPEQMKDMLRSRLLKCMLLSLGKNDAAQ